MLDNPRILSLFHSDQITHTGVNTRRKNLQSYQIAVLDANFVRMSSKAYLPQQLFIDFKKFILKCFLFNT